MNKNIWKAVLLVALGINIAAAGVYVGHTDDAPGAALLGFLLAIGMIALAVRIARRKPRSRVAKI